ncbi:G-type lectin S-receptor-like serine/threonine-protein kinase At1g34300 [Cucurbita maxima]|uniref:Receptor-like serine/threonine-protein kinase n=1 Tax=Cucurbita maxima TaxID=3661 RepID=A0A6J1JY39_CUCMA|nr:G-type lectin S-receptor-like serine/threonine-protein kinase At1g34300 [Cucurbita maxima]XP_022992645.1 G-type lectin S-receptor-like serine/threonine-protein kinase At1g34300 [Cucurbita maxima]
MDLHSHLFRYFIALVLCLSVSLSVAAISLGSSLRASNPNQTWDSANGIFSLRFLPADSSGSSFIAGIVFTGGVPTIWSAGGGATVDASGALHFQSDGNLRLVDGSGAVVWESNTTGRGVSSAVLEDSGNLILRNSSSQAVWSSFDHPTDTIVPSQNFTVGMVLRSGQYSFNLLNIGNITLTWNGDGPNGDVVYWNHGLNTSINGSLNSPSLRLGSIGMLAVYDTRIPAGSFVAYSNDYADNGGGATFRFLRLKDDGNLEIHSVVRGSGSESVGWKAVPDKCQIFGFCGELSICSYNDTSPICSCPSANFEPVDHHDWKKGCKAKLDIRNCSSGITMLEMKNTKLLTYPKNLEVYSMQISGCQSNCRQSSACDASTAPSDGNGFCYYIPSGFIRGYQSAALPSSSFLKVCGEVLENQLESSDVSRPGGTNLKAWVLAVVVLVTLFAMIVCEAGLWWWCCRNSPKFGGMSSQYTLLEYASGAPVQFSFKELHRVTNGFKEKLGAGGFGAVYKGVLTNKTVVAVKQLEGIEQGEKQFRMEVATISSTHHLNLVRLVGFCSEGRHRLLVYELMKNGSLDSLLFKGEEGQSGKFLSWEDRFKIAAGTAKGITYLHEECRDCIIHCDIKPENILLDENLNAKVSDFGLAKLINMKDHRYRTLTSIRGTRGYLAPEWLANLPLTSKSDVFSYGMVLLEIVSGRRNFDVSAETNHKRFSLWAYEEFEKGNLIEIVDKRLVDQDIDMEQVSRVVQVGFWCIQEQPSQRPTMGKVVQMMEGVIDIERPPAPKVTSMVSATGTSTYISSNLSNFSAVETPATPASFSLSLAAADLTPGGSICEKTSSSLLHSRYDTPTSL